MATQLINVERSASYKTFLLNRLLVLRVSDQFGKNV